MWLSKQSTVISYLWRVRKDVTYLFNFYFVKKIYLNFQITYLIFPLQKKLLEFSNYLSNFSFAKKIYSNYLFNFYFIKKIYLNFSNSIELFIQFYFKKKFQIIILGKIFNYSFEFYFMKNLFNILQKKIYLNFILQKKYSDYSLVLWRHILHKTFY